MRAWANCTFLALANGDAEALAAALSARAAYKDQGANPQTMGAWTQSVVALQDTARALQLTLPESAAWHVFFEFEIPRRSRRIDAVVLAGSALFVIEWKGGAAQFENAARMQVLHYALDLHDFHEASHDKVIIPILVAAEYVGEPAHRFDAPNASVHPIRTVGPGELPGVLAEHWAALDVAGRQALDPAGWEDAPYNPTPTIVAAGTLLYEGHDVRDIALAGSANLDETVQAVLEFLQECRETKRHGIAFVTGAPGAGKTLAGLRIVHSDEIRAELDTPAVFLSGNMPLVSVMGAALVKSAQRGGKTRRAAESEVHSFIQHAYQFREDNLKYPDRAPHERVILFDEAQRAWNSKRLDSWSDHASGRSEPEAFLDIMSRWTDWSLVIALVGSGQEIGDGESGLGEWGRALRTSHRDWVIRASPNVLPGAPEPPGGWLFETAAEGLDVSAVERLHLDMNVRSPRAEKLNGWVDALLGGQPAVARELIPDERFPLVVTRHLDLARDWLREMAPGEPERTGLLVSANARRLQAWGLDAQVLRRERKWAEWFLAGRDDVRGSNQLEIAATNFDCQGLEIDWAGVVWGNDLVPEFGLDSWDAKRFVGTRWTSANPMLSKYIVNGYRVILTRARRGQIICVPEPDGRDKTLPPEEFDRIAEMLQRAGVPSID